MNLIKTSYHPVSKLKGSQETQQKVSNHLLANSLFFLWLRRALILTFMDDLKSRLWLFFFPFLLIPKKRGKKKRKMNSKNRDFKSCLSARSHLCYKNFSAAIFLFVGVWCLIKRIIC